MGAHVEHAFDRGFILDEEKVRKIKDTLEARLSRRTNPLAPTYKVYRGDSFSYTTTSVDDVIHEDNEDWRRITQLDVLVEEKDVLELRLRFQSKGAEVTIDGNDRDEVFLLFSDLRDYIQNEVALAPAGKKVAKLVVGLIPFGIMLFFLYFLVKMSPTEGALRYARETKDVAAKLNFLIEESARRNPNSLIGILVAFIGFIVLVATGLPDKLMAYFFPTNVFVFGKQRQIFERRQKTRDNIVWVGLVGLIVSLVAGFLVWYATSKK